MLRTGPWLAIVTRSAIAEPQTSTPFELSDFLQVAHLFVSVYSIFHSKKLYRKR